MDRYEGKRRFIGPMFLVAEAMVMMGQRTNLAEAMGEIDVTVR